MRALTSCAIAGVLFVSMGVAAGALPIRVTAKHGSGAIYSDEGDVGAFEISILPSGKTSISTLTQRHGHLRKTTRSISLGPGQVERIVRAVTVNGFFQLPSKMEGGAEDSPVYTLDIVLGCQHKKVRVHAPAFYSDKSVLRRFRRVWAAVSHAAGFTEDPEALHHLKANA